MFAFPLTDSKGHPIIMSRRGFRSPRCAGGTALHAAREDPNTVGAIERLYGHHVATMTENWLQIFLVLSRTRYSPVLGSPPCKEHAGLFALSGEVGFCDRLVWTTGEAFQYSQSWGGRAGFN
jgi:hypothetical protein